MGKKMSIIEWAQKECIMFDENDIKGYWRKCSRRLKRTEIVSHKDKLSVIVFYDRRLHGPSLAWINISKGKPPVLYGME